MRTFEKIVNILVNQPHNGKESARQRTRNMGTKMVEKIVNVFLMTHLATESASTRTRRMRRKMTAPKVAERM